MSTDTAFALGVLALVGPHFPDRLRAFMLTVFVVDDIVALVVIAIVYSTRSRVRHLARRASSSSALVLVRAAAASASGLVYLVLGAAGVGRDDAVRRRPGRGRPRDGPDDVRLRPRRASTSSARATSSGSSASSRRPSSRARRRSACSGAISPNDRLQQLFHPWTSYVIVPLFALANIGDPISGELPLDGVQLAGHARDHRRLRPRQAGRDHRRVVARDEAQPRPAAAAGRLGGRRGRRARRRDRLHRLAPDRRPRVPRRAARARRSSACSAPALLASALLLAPLPRDDSGCRRGSRSGRSRDADAADRPRRAGRRGARPHPRAGRRAGDAGRVRRLRVPVLRPGRAGRPRAAARSRATCGYVWRHLPLNDVHPRAQLAAEAREAAAAQGAFWEMHDLLLDHQDALEPPDLVGYARELGLDVDRFTDDLRRARLRGPDRRGRRRRRPQQRLGHADLLRQRPPPPRRLRHRDALGRGEGRARAGACPAAR